MSLTIVKCIIYLIITATLNSLANIFPFKNNFKTEKIFFSVTQVMTTFINHQSTAKTSVNIRKKKKKKKRRPIMALTICLSEQKEHFKITLSFILLRVV